MKRLLWILILAFTFTQAKPCMTDIYFGNGVWNTRSQAIESRNALRKFMQINYKARLNRDDESITYTFKLAYNPTRGTIEDLLETFWQLKESGQISEGYFMAKWNLLTIDRGPNELRKAMNRVATTNTVDVNRMYNVYKDASFSKKHNILLIAHSQGNLFGNTIYAMLADIQKKKFRMVSVGTPANHVMEPSQTAPYVTVQNDYVINRISGALPGNVDGFGHTFIGTYIGSSFESRTQIALYVKTAYDDLIQNTSCVECSYVRTMVSEINKMTVECQVFGTYRTEVIGTFYARKYDAVTLPNGDKSCKDPFKFAGFPNLIHTNTDGLYSWETGRFSSKEQLYSRKGKEETYLYLNSSQCIKLSVSGDYYDLVESALAN